MTSTRLQLIDAIDSVEIDRIDGETIKSVGRQRYDMTAMKAFDNSGNELRFGLVGMNTECFSRQNLAPVQVTTISHHSTVKARAQWN
jgi:hypothetical protein